MKKVSVTIILIIFIGSMAVLAASPVINDYVAKKTAEKLAELPLPEDTELIESVYRAGKLVGNGNGMQYFGAILIKSELPLEKLKEYYSSFAEHEWACIVENQAEEDIKIIEHARLAFKADVKGEDYYIVYSWGDNNTIFHEFDIRGH